MVKLPFQWNGKITISLKCEKRYFKRNSPQCVVTDILCHEMYPLLVGFRYTLAGSVIYLHTPACIYLVLWCARPCWPYEECNIQSRPTTFQDVVGTASWYNILVSTCVMFVRHDHISAGLFLRLLYAARVVCPVTICVWELNDEPSSTIMPGQPNVLHWVCEHILST